MTMPKGQSSGRGNARLSSAIGKPEREPKPRKPLSQVSTRKLADGRVDASQLGIRRNQSFGEPSRPSLKRTRGLRVKPGGADAAGAWREAAFERVIAEHGRLVDEATGANLPAADAQVHHVLEAGDLFTQGPEAVALAIWHPANSMVLHRDTHARHHSRQAPIPRERLRPETWGLVAELDDLAGPQWWLARVERDYPEVA